MTGAVVGREIARRVRPYRTEPGPDLAPDLSEGMDLLTALKIHRRLVLVGPAGAGKSTALQSLETQLRSLRGVFPVRRSFHFYVDEKITEYLELPAGVRDGDLFVLLDGLDEVSETRMPDTIRRIEFFAESFPGAHIIVSIRENFYRPPREGRAGTLTGFRPFQLQLLKSIDIDGYVRGVLGAQAEDFQIQAKEGGLEDLVASPFYLVRLAQVYREDSKLPERSEIMERFLKQRIGHDQSKYRSLIDLYSEAIVVRILTELERLALVMQASELSTLDQEQFHRTVPDQETREILKRCTVWSRVGSDVPALNAERSDWSFEHASYREYLAARALSKRTFAQARQWFESSNHRPGPRWVNVLSYLAGMVDWPELISWVRRHHPLVLIQFETTRLAPDIRATTFRELIEESSEAEISLEVRGIAVRTMARFGDVPEIHQYLPAAIEQARMVAGEQAVLDRVHPDLENRVYCAGFQNPGPEAREEYAAALHAVALDARLHAHTRYAALIALGNLRLARGAGEAPVLTDLRETTDPYLRAGLYYYVSCLAEPGDAIDTLLAGIPVLLPRLQADTLIDESLMLVEALARVRAPAALKKFFAYLSEFPDYNGEPMLVRRLPRMITNAVAGYPADPELFERVFDLYLVCFGLYRNAALILVDFFAETETRIAAIERVFERKAEVGYHFYEAIEPLVDADGIVRDFLLNFYRSGDLPIGDVQRIILALDQGTPDIAADWAEKFEVDYEPAWASRERRTHEQEAQSRAELELLLDQHAFRVICLNVFDERERISRSDLFDQPPPGPVWRFLSRAAKEGTVEKARVLDWIQRYWDDFRIPEIYEWLRQNSNLEPTDEQIRRIAEWCNARLPMIDFRTALLQGEEGSFAADQTAIHLWYFRRRLKLSYPEPVLLDMLSFDWLAEGGMQGLREIAELLPRDRVVERLHANLKAGIANTEIFLNHIVYLLDADDSRAVDIALRELMNSGRDDHSREKILVTLIRLGTSLSAAIETLDSGNSDFFWRAAAHLARERDPALKACLLARLEGQDRNERKKAASLLVEFEDERGLDAIADLLEQGEDFPDHRVELPPLYKLKNIDLLPGVRRLLQELVRRLTSTPDDFHLQQMLGHAQKAIENMALADESNFSRIDQLLGALAQESGPLRPTFVAFRSGLEQLVERTFSRPISFNEALNRLTGTDPPDGFNEPRETGLVIRASRSDPEPIFDVFLCHNSVDKPAVIELAKKLQEAGLRPWLDAWNIRPGQRWQEVLEEQTISIRSAVVCLGPNGVGPWQDREINAFLREFIKDQRPIIPVFLPGLKSEPEMPVFLKEYHGVDMRGDPEDAIRKLIWGITGIEA